MSLLSPSRYWIEICCIIIVWQRVLFSLLDICIFWQTADRLSPIAILADKSFYWCISENIIVFHHFPSLSMHMGIFQWRKHLHIANNSCLFCILLFTTSWIFIYTYIIWYIVITLFFRRATNLTNSPTSQFCMHIYIILLRCSDRIILYVCSFEQKNTILSTVTHLFQFNSQFNFRIWECFNEMQQYDLSLFPILNFNEI